MTESLATIGLLEDFAKLYKAAAERNEANHD